MAEEKSDQAAVAGPNVIGESHLENLAYAADLFEQDRQPFKVAWISALIVHFLLFVTVFPELGTSEVESEEREAVVIKRYKPPEPPKQQPEKKVVKRRTSRVPIPDPTPDDPEPIMEENVEYVETEIENPDVEFLVGAPPSGPPVIEQGPMRVGGEIQAPELINRVNPGYPELARRARLEGVVILEAIIDQQGSVRDVNILRGLGLGLDESAVDAVSQWQYTPTFYNGRPVEVLLTVTVQFQLQ